MILIKEMSYQDLKSTIGFTGILLAVFLSFIALACALHPAMIAGTVTYMMALGYIALVSALWLGIFHCTKGYIRQWFIYTKGEIK